MKATIQSPAKRRAAKPPPVEWPPPECRLPDLATLEALSQPAAAPEAGDQPAGRVVDFRTDRRRRRTGLAFPDVNAL